jgi:hypothetical protein
MDALKVTSTDTFSSSPDTFVVTMLRNWRIKHRVAHTLATLPTHSHADVSDVRMCFLSAATVTGLQVILSRHPYRRLHSHSGELSSLSQVSG